MAEPASSEKLKLVLDAVARGPAHRPTYEKSTPE